MTFVSKINGIQVPNFSITSTTWTSSANSYTINTNIGVGYPTFINEFSGLTINGSLSATTYQNLPSPYKTTILTGGTSYTFTDFKVVNTISINKTTGSITTIILNQTPNVNDFYVVKDRKGDSFTNQIVITGGTYTIDGNASVIMKSKNNPSLTFLFDGSEYIII